jgi:hypothetical protein
MKRRLFNIAWSVVNQFNSFGEALAHAWKVIKLQVELCIGVVKFAYMKKDGTRREATGTLMDVPAVKGERKPNFGLLTYFDIDCSEWRSCLIQNIIF